MLQKEAIAFRKPSEKVGKKVGLRQNIARRPQN